MLSSVRTLPEWSWQSKHQTDLLVFDVIVGGPIVVFEMHQYFKITVDNILQRTAVKAVLHGDLDHS